MSAIAKTAAILLCAALPFCGCSSVTVCREGGHVMAVVENSGWYLLNFIPLGSGNPEKPNRFSFNIFSDTVKVENNLKMLHDLMESEGAASYRDMSTYTTEESIMVILFKRYHCHTSVELVFPEKDARKTPAVPATEE